MATAPTAASSLPTSGGTSSQGLADWAAPYITDYLSRAQALSNSPYQTYQGPLTAGASSMQTKAFQGIGNLTVPTGVTGAAATAEDLAAKAAGASYTPTSFSSTFNAPAAYAPTTFQSGFQAPEAYTAADFSQFGFEAPEAYKTVGGTFTDQGIAQKYMNPYLKEALMPTLDELRRQSQITQLKNAAQLTGAGAFGGSRQAIMDAETQRNLLSQVAKTTGESYANAYDKAAAQFNAEQTRNIQEAQFAAKQGMDFADLRAKYGLEAARAAEQSRQFGYEKGLSASEIAARLGLEASKASEQSRQFGAQQGMTAAEAAARYGLEAAKASEQSRQYGAGFGLEALGKQLTAAQLRGDLAKAQADIERANLDQMLRAGNAERTIEQEGIAADLAEFNAQREFPYKQAQYMRDMISGLPVSSVTNTPTQLSGIAQLITAVGGIDKLLKDTGQSSLSDLLGNLGFKFGSTETV